MAKINAVLSSALSLDSRVYCLAIFSTLFLIISVWLMRWGMHKDDRIAAIATFVFFCFAVIACTIVGTGVDIKNSIVPFIALLLIFAATIPFMGVLICGSDMLTLICYLLVYMTTIFVLFYVTFGWSYSYLVAKICLTVLLIEYFISKGSPLKKLINKLFMLKKQSK
jgi:hypothetical protein